MSSSNPAAHNIQSIAAPAERIATDPDEDSPDTGIALCLSGGGYRAMVFHLGALLRLNELGILPKLARISSVSGGSIAAGVLAAHWNELGFDGNGVAQNFAGAVTDPICRLASTTIDKGSILAGVLLPGSVSDKVRDAYKRYLFGDLTLQDIPLVPRFVFNATNVQSMALWRFSKPYMRDYRVGEVKNPKVDLALVVAASSAFPPFLSPAELELDATAYTPGSGLDLQREPFTTRVVLTDGGVYDNLGLETAWKRYTTILVSDGGGAYAPEPEPKHDWAQHVYRVMNLIDNQVRCLRKRQLITSFRHGERDGTYWGVRTHIADYGLGDCLPCPPDRTTVLAQTPTRLEAMKPQLQEKLINWGYAVCDAATRKHVLQDAVKPTRFPYPSSQV